MTPRILCLEQQAAALKLSAETQAELIAEIRTVQAQVTSPNPKSSIVCESLNVVGKILERVTEKAVTPGCTSFIDCSEILCSAAAW
jgi:hypothetical protein